MRFFIIGCNGMVGHVISLYLRENGHDVLGYDSEPSRFIKCEVGSIYDTKTIKYNIDKHNFDAIINCTAIINQDAENDKAAASFINAYLPHFLEKITENTNTIVVHRSTDCIFSGDRGQYDICDIPDAKSFYARTKSIGELVNQKDITIRTSLIGPDLSPSGNSLFNWFMKQTGDVNGYANAFWTGITTLEFAKEIEYLVKHKASGLFQCVPEYKISKYELLLLFEKYMPGDRNLIRINNQLVDKSLIQRIGDYGLKIPNYETMIGEMLSWIKNSEIYNYKI